MTSESTFRVNDILHYQLDHEEYTFYVSGGEFSQTGDSKGHFSGFTQVSRKAWPRGYKTFFVLNSTEHDIFPVH